MCFFSNCQDFNFFISVELHALFSFFQNIGVECSAQSSIGSNYNQITLFTGLCSANTLVTFSSNVALIFWISSVSFSAYGRMAVIASCAFLSFAAETIFMAGVIWMVDDT